MGDLNLILYSLSKVLLFHNCLFQLLCVKLLCEKHVKISLNTEIKLYKIFLNRISQNYLFKNAIKNLF